MPEGAAETPSQEVTRRDAGAGGGGLAAGPPLALSTPLPRPASGEGRPRIGRFEVLSELGRGGYGIVYRCLDPTLGRPCAVKLLIRDEAAGGKARERLVREARAVARLGKHPHIVHVHEAGTTPEGQAYIAMELVEGESLDKIAARRAIGWREAGEIVHKVAHALEHAHRHGLIHRDVKPSNVILDARGEPQVTDFGVAKDLESGSDTLTRPGSAVGTPAFMSPEQAEGRPVDARSDVYAMGALLYALVRGRPPFVAPNVAIVLAMVIDRDPPRLRTRKNRCPRDLETVVFKAMEKDADRRYPSAEALAADLARVLDGEPCEARRPGVPERIARYFRQRPRNLIILLGIAGAAFLVYRFREEQVARQALERRLHGLSQQEAVHARLGQLPTLGTHDERLRLLERAERDFPGSWEPPYERGQVERQMASGRESIALYRAAEASFGRAIERGPENVFPWFWRATVRHEGLNDHEGAAADLAEAARRAPPGDAIGEIARLALTVPANEADLLAVSLAIRRQPDLTLLQELRACARVRRGEAAAALEDLDRLAGAAPFCARGFAHAAQAYDALGRAADAERARGRAAAIERALAESREQR